MTDHLRNLCMLNGASGDEDKVREYIIKNLSADAEYHTDNLGNLIVFKKGKKTPSRKIMLDAHMDEVALIVTSVKEDGTLTVNEVGGVDPSVVIGRQVVLGKNGMTGVTGSRAVHNLSREEREKAPSMESIYVDFGAGDREEAEKYIQPGDYIYFAQYYTELGNNCITSKAIDDRFGCALLLELINSELEYDTYFTFSVQEEIGLRGARTAAFSVQPDIAIVTETTTAADVDGVSGNKRVCSLGKGAVVSYMDRSTMYDHELYTMAFELAAEKGIPCQTKTMIAGGNNSGAIHVTGCGVRTIAVSLPCRYLHSPSCTANRNDMDACLKLVSELMKKAAQL
ncbi:MAG: M42 family metallopeptidase [Porcipelethomonas sp.]